MLTVTQVYRVNSGSWLLLQGHGTDLTSVDTQGGDEHPEEPCLHYFCVAGKNYLTLTS